MRRIVLIDGENLSYGIRYMLGSDGNKAPRSAVENFNFRGLLEEVLAEKGVDVGLAVRIVLEANPETEIVVISADTDLLSAFIAANKLGAKLMHIGYEIRPIYALTKVSDITRTITLPLVQKYKA